METLKLYQMEKAGGLRNRLFSFNMEIDIE